MAKMKINVTDGQTTIDAKDLGPLLGLEPAEVPERMRSGDITSRSEIGVGEDEGRFRLYFFHNQKQVRLTCASDGTVLFISKTPVVPPRRPA
ncbi:DUF6522 family protein [Flavimaricola marinus]|uniref:Uncharacterized protein n=1 Tax=Flavimaricola marinus TaxID=1819565 RepID=A0A238LIQ0_9RHOB|nr:DUF6522 family protein [Flavimaricola marinus]SMY09423.1 hypothetical protein LOM8899_03590 [Flavimaricola marinus]